MNLILDLILIAIAAFCVMYGWKRGFFKSIMFFGSGIASLLLAYAFAPSLGKVIKDKFIIDGISGSLEKTFSSIARGEGGYDVSRLSGDAQFSETVTRYGANEGEIAEIIEGSGAAESIIEKVSLAVANPIATTLGRIIAFIIIFVIALIVLRVLTTVIGFLFELPVLRTLDKGMGIAFGIVCALFFVWIYSMAIGFVYDAVFTVSSGGAAESKPLLCGFFAKINPIGWISQLLGY